MQTWGIFGVVNQASPVLKRRDRTGFKKRIPSQERQRLVCLNSMGFTLPLYPIEISYNTGTLSTEALIDAGVDITLI